MTNKPTWEEQFSKKFTDNVLKDGYGNDLTTDQAEPIMKFISTKLAEQRKQFKDMIESMTDDALVLPIFRDGYNCAKTEILHKINLLKQ